MNLKKFFSVEMTSPSFNAVRIGRAWGTPLSYRARYLSPARVLKQVKP